MRLKNKDWNLICGIMAANPDSYISYEEIMESDQDNDYPFVDMTGYSTINPEEFLLKKERWELLREEAKQVIETLVNCPREIINDIFGLSSKKRYSFNPDKKLEHIKIETIVSYLYRKWGPGEYYTILDIMKEIKIYLRETA